MIGSKPGNNGWSDAMSDDDCVRLDTRLAGQVRRYHTWPIVKEQSIAEHCWQLMRIYLSIVDKIDAHMIRHIIFHDIGEHYTGDIPYPVKRNNPRLKEEMDFLEIKSQNAQMEFWDSFKQVALSAEDRKLFKHIELIEMAEFGLDQMNLGNSHGYVIANRCLEAVYKNQPCMKLVQYVIKRLRLYYQQQEYAKEIPYTEDEWWDYDKWEQFHDSKPDSSGRGLLQD